MLPTQRQEIVDLFTDLGTDGTTSGYMNRFSGEILATGFCRVPFVEHDDTGYREQLPEDWDNSVIESINSANQQYAARYSADPDPSAWGISGQMHGEGAETDDGKAKMPAKLWCDARGNELQLRIQQLITERLGRQVKVPRRFWISRYLYSRQNNADACRRHKLGYTPAGRIVRIASGAHRVGIGDASGMAPLADDGQYDEDVLNVLEDLVPGDWESSLYELLPEPCPAGEIQGRVSAEFAERCSVPQGIPLVSEGDQQATLADEELALSYGTSVGANIPADIEFQGIHPAVDPFWTSYKKRMYMVCVQNGSGWYNALTAFFMSWDGLDYDTANEDVKNEYRRKIDLLADTVPAGCHNVLNMSFLQMEQAIGGTSVSALIGLNDRNFTPAVFARAAIEGPVLTVDYGLRVLQKQGIKPQSITLSGGAVNSAHGIVPRIIADVTGLPVIVRSGANEGSGVGACRLAGYAHTKQTEPDLSWFDYLSRLQLGRTTVYNPDGKNVDAYRRRKADVDHMIDTHMADRFGLPMFQTS